MKSNTTQLIKLVVDAYGNTEETKASLKNLLTRIWVDGQLDGLDKAKEIYSDLHK